MREYYWTVLSVMCYHTLVECMDKGTGTLVNTDLHPELEALRTRYDAIRGHL
jgi:hypothetical protein